MIVQLIAPTQIGGLETVVSQLLRSAHTDGLPMACVALLSANEPMPSELQALSETGVRIVRVAAPHRRYVAQYRSVLRALRLMDARVVHSHGAHADVLGVAAARALGTAHLSTLHGFIPGGAKTRLFDWLQLRQLRSSAAVVAVSAGIADRARAEGIASHKIHLFPNAAPESALLGRAESRTMLGIPQEARVVGWIGRLSPEKDPEAFVRVMGHLRPELAAVGVMIGDGAQSAAIRRVAEDQIQQGRFILTGSVHEARRYLRAFDAVAVTSVTEGTPMVVLEALRAGVPVVSTAVGGVPALLVAGAGALVEYGDWTEFSTTLERILLNDEIAVAMSERGLSRVQADYSLARWWQRYRELYERLQGRWEL